MICAGQPRACTSSSAYETNPPRGLPVGSLLVRTGRRGTASKNVSGRRRLLTAAIRVKRNGRPFRLTRECIRVARSDLLRLAHVKIVKRFHSFGVSGRGVAPFAEAGSALWYRQPHQNGHVGAAWRACHSFSPRSVTIHGDVTVRSMRGERKYLYFRAVTVNVPICLA